MNYIITSDLKYKDRMWLPIMGCPKCGYETTVTNICRNCPETPIIVKLTSPVFCGTHDCFHFKDNPDGTKTYLTHESVVMVYTGKVRKFSSDEIKEFEAKPDEMSKIWCGHGVVFDESTL